jgi:activator of HSP90 ATPase
MPASTRKKASKPAKKTVTLQQKTLVSATPDEVYDAFVDPKKHAAFTGAKATGTAKVGGHFTAWDDYISGTYVELEQGKKLVMEWQTVSWTEGYGPSNLLLTFKKHGSGTELSMVHSKVPPIPAKGFRTGWKKSYWDLLQAYFGK